MLEQRRVTTAVGDELCYWMGPANGPPLILLHGVLRNHRDFSPLIGPLSVNAQLVLLDFRGHGQSERSREGYRVIDYVVDAEQILAEVGPAIIYGHSLGAMVAAVLAARHPQMVRGAILEDPPFDTMGNRLIGSPLAPFFAGVQRVLAESTTDDVAALAAALGEIVLAETAKGPTLLRDVRDGVSIRFSARCLQEIDHDVLVPIVAGGWLEGYEQQEIAQLIRAPLLLLQADSAAGGMLMDADAQVWSDGEDRHRIRFPGQGHLLHWTATSAVVRHTLTFCESLADIKNGP